MCSAPLRSVPNAIQAPLDHTGVVPRRWGWRLLGLLVSLVVATLALTGAVAGTARFVSRAISRDEDGPSVATPPAGTYYHGVYPGGRTGWEDDITAGDLDAYEQAVGREAAWVYFSDNWFRDRDFPVETATWIRERGAIPVIRLMLRGRDPAATDETYRLQHILDGDFDRDLAAWGRDAAAFGSPIVVEWGTEMNGRWFGWNARWNGRADGARRFRQAYRHIERTIEGAGADNITWAWHVNGDSVPDTPWNQIDRYYPGDRFVDWVGLSAYGALTPADQAGDWRPFRETLDEVVPELTEIAPDKPIMVFEFGMTRGSPSGTPAAFADAALDDLLANRWPAVRGFSWWNETWPNDDDPAHDTDMRVQALGGVRRAFRDYLVGNDDVLDHPFP